LAFVIIQFNCPVFSTRLRKFVQRIMKTRTALYLTVESNCSLYAEIIIIIIFLFFIFMGLCIIIYKNYIYMTNDMQLGNNLYC
jgi:hypothetical protein